MTNQLRDIFTEDVIEIYQKNKHEITEELLASLRAHSKEGKHIALEMLDLDKDNEQYYLDAFGNRMTFNGNRRLKKAFTKLDLSPIHRIEIEKCANDIHYFKDNYIKIKTKAGINFPDMRDYQNDFIDTIMVEESESIVSLQGRQSGKTITTAIYLGHCVIFKHGLNIGITANKAKQAKEFLANTKNILIELPAWLQVGMKTWNKSFIEAENGMRILTDVPSSDSFRGFTIDILVVDECAFIKPTIWEEFSDSIFPSQSALAWKKNIILSTAKGMNHFYEIVKGAREETNGYKLFEVSWKDVPRYKSDGTQLTNEEFYTQIVGKFGIIYFNQNYANEFLGSSHTLISSDKLRKMNHTMPEEHRDGKLKIYQYPKNNHKYIMAVDPAKDGTDAFAVQILDITDFKFEQVASAQLQIDYLLMPEFIDEWGKLYNNAYLVIENNEGAGQSIADQMYQSYEYENLHFDKDVGRNKRKRYPGFRTTSKTRKQVLQTLKLFIENDKLDVIDKPTINEFFQFVLIKNKFQADDGAKDDMIMALALVFAPFMNTKNFEDMRAVVSGLYDEDVDIDDKPNFADLLAIGDFDQGLDEDYVDVKPKEYETIEAALLDQDGFM